MFLCSKAVRQKHVVPCVLPKLTPSLFRGTIEAKLMVFCLRLLNNTLFLKAGKGLDHQPSDGEEPILQWTLTEGSECLLSFQALAPATPLALLEYAAALPPKHVFWASRHNSFCVLKNLLSSFISHVKNNTFSICIYV